MDRTPGKPPENRQKTVGKPSGGRRRRANVEDTPELLAYYDELEQLDAGALWTVANKIEPWEPKSASVPVLWRYRDLREHVLRSVELVTPEKAGRRVIYLNNPGPARRRRRGGLALFRPAGDEPRRGRLGARAFGLGAALHHGRRGRLHHRRRPQDDARRQRLRADAERHLARARRRRATARPASGRTASTFRSSTRWKPISTRCIRTCTRRSAIPSTTPPTPGAIPACGPPARTGRKGYSPLFKYEWAPDLRGAAALRQGHRRLAF